MRNLNVTGGIFRFTEQVFSGPNCISRLQFPRGFNLIKDITVVKPIFYKQHDSTSPFIENSKRSDLILSEMPLAPVPRMLFATGFVHVF